MNYDTEWQVQQAVVTALVADVTLVAAVTGIYDHTPQKTAYPYIMVEDMDMLEWDTKSWNGGELTLNIHVWSRYRGRQECVVVFGHLRRILHHQALIVTGHDHVLTRREHTEVFVDPDGVTRHGIAMYRMLVHNIEEE